MTSETGVVYTLNDPRTGEPKYVGATVDPGRRLESHQSSPTNEKMRTWMESLEKCGLEPEIDVVRVAPTSELREEEREIVEDLAERWDLLNAPHHIPYSPGRIREGGGSKQVKIPDPVYEKADDISKDRDTSIKEAIRMVFMEAGYDV